MKQKKGLQGVKVLNHKIVIVGNGITAVTALKSIRDVDKNSEIHLIGDEKFFPYNRIRLSKGLLNTLEEDNILLQKKEWYKSNNINLHLNTEVTSINIKEKKVQLSNGNTIDYTKLLLAQGAHNLKPTISGINKKGVTTLRTLKDAWNIIEQIKNSNVVLIIGGGIQGLEIAWILSNMGKKVIIAELLPRLMPNQLDEKASKILQKAVRSHGIDIMLNTEISEIYGEDIVEGFTTKKGNSIPCNMIVYSIGIKSNTEILKDTGININRGIIINEQMETNIKDIYAAGDVAELNHKISGLWNISIGQGKVAGYNIAEKCAIYEHIVPVTTLKAFNLSLFSMGIIEEDKATDIIVEDKSENIYNKVFLNNNKIIGAIVIGQIRYSPALKIAIEKEIDLSDVNLNNVTFKDLIEIIKKKNKLGV